MGLGAILSKKGHHNMNDLRGNDFAKPYSMPEVYTVSLPREQNENPGQQENPDALSDPSADTLVLHARVEGDPFSSVSLPRKRPLLSPKQPPQ